MMPAARCTGITMAAACLVAATLNPSSTLRADGPNKPASAPQQAIELVAQANNQFAWSIYKHRSQSADKFAAQNKAHPKNLFLSPLSLSSALTMTATGARGQTARQMADALHLPNEPATVDAGYAALLAQLGPPAQTSRFPSLVLSVANAVWPQAGDPLSPEFTHRVTTSYAASVQALDFAADPDAARQTINDSVAKATAQKIPALLSAGDVRRDTRLVLTNAVYFKANWAKPFLTDATAPAPFHLADGSQVSVPTMNASLSANYSETDTLRALELLYSGGRQSMVVILPKAGSLADLEAALTPAMFDAALSQLRLVQARVALPKFSTKSRFDATSDLMAMGMTDAFTAGRADFSGIDGTRSLVISSVIHEAVIDVDERGTEAAAATAVVKTRSMLPIEPSETIEFRVDRPFLLAIRDRPTGTLLFVGCIHNPAR